MSVLPLLALGCVLFAAALLRFLEIGTNPGGLYLDEAAEALDAHRLLTLPDFHPIFFPDGGGREALFGYLVAAGFRLFGESTLVLRATAASIGVAGVFGIWLLARRFGLAAGLAGAAWAAGSLWLICVSRDGMRNTLVPLFSSVCLAMLLTWAARPERRSALAAGAMTAAASFYVYQPLKLLPLVVLLWFVWMRRTDPNAYSRLRPTIPAVAVSFILVAAPMLLVALIEPNNYFGRILGVLPTAGGQTVDLPEHWLRTLGMFVITGDPNARHNVAALPLLGLPLFSVAAVGVACMWRKRREPANLLMLVSLPIFLLPPLLATEGGAPHFLRSLGLAAPLGVAIGVGVQGIVARSRRWCGRDWSRIAASAAALGLLALAVASGHAYLSRTTADRYQAYSYDLVALAAAANGHSAVIVDDYSATVIRFLDDSDLPVIVARGERISTPERFVAILALSRADIEHAVGGEVAKSAQVVVRDPAGQPVVWALR